MLLAALAFILVLAGCQQGGQGDADTEEIHAHIGEVQTRLETIEEQVMSLAEGEAIATEAQEELAAAQATLAQVDERLTLPSSPNLLLNLDLTHLLPPHRRIQAFEV